MRQTNKIRITGSVRLSFGLLALAFAAVLGAACDDVRLGADRGRPIITVESPERGDTIVASAEQTISLRGRVDPGTGALVGLTAQIDDSEPVWVDLAADGSFDTSVVATAGNNLLLLEAVNTAGRRGRALRSFHYAPAFVDPAGAPVDLMLHGQLTDWALDWGSPLDRFPYDPCAFDGNGVYRCEEIRDLASLFEMALNQVDFSALQAVTETSVPLIEESWTINLLDFAEVRIRIEGQIDLVFTISDLSVGQAKVLKLDTVDGGLTAQVVFGPHADQAGLSATVSLETTQTLAAWLDIASDDPGTQDTLCDIASILCNIFPPHDCLDEYLESCVADPTPLASSISGLDAPVLGTIAVDEMRIEADLSVGFDEQAGEALVELTQLELDLALGALDLSAFEDVTIELGTVQVAGYDIDLGEFHIPQNFLTDMLDFLTDLLLNAIAPLVEPLLGELFSCDQPDNPLCLVVPFMEEMLAAFQVSGVLALPAGPGMAPILVDLTTDLSGVMATSFYGIGLDLAAAFSGPQAPEVISRRDDDFLGLARIQACFQKPTPFVGPPTGNRSMQLAPSVDLVTWLFLAAWEAGALDLSASHSDLGLPADLHMEDLRIQLKPLLPPLINPCTQMAQTLLELGDTRFELDMTRAGRRWVASGYLAVELPVDFLAGDDDRPGLIRSDKPGIIGVEYEMIEMDGTPLGDSERDALTALLRDHLLPALLSERLDLVVSELDALYPVFDITRFPGLTPGQGFLSMGNCYATAASGHLVINGDLTQP